MKTLIALIFSAVLSLAQSVPAVNTPLTKFPLGSIRVVQKWNITNSGSNFLITKPDGTTTTVAKAAATTQSISLLTPATFFKVTDCSIRTATAFVGTTALTATIGVTGNLTGCLSVAYNLKTVTPNSAVPTVIVSAPSFNGTDAIILALTSTIDNISSISVGSVTVYVEIVYLPSDCN